MPLSTFSLFSNVVSSVVLLLAFLSSKNLLGVLKNKGSYILCGIEGAIDLLLRVLLKFLTSFYSANEPPILNERFKGLG